MTTLLTKLLKQETRQIERNLIADNLKHANQSLMLLQTITFSIIFLLWISIIAYNYYKIGEQFFRAVASNNNREYSGYNSELVKINPIRLVGIFPVPYITELEMNKQAISHLEIRKKYIIRFYLNWFGMFIFFFLFKDLLN